MGKVKSFLKEGKISKVKVTTEFPIVSKILPQKYKSPIYFGSRVTCIAKVEVLLKIG